MDVVLLLVFGVFRGYKDVMVILIVVFIFYWLIGFLVGYGLLFMNFGLFGYWIGLSIGLFVVVFILFIWVCKME